MRYLQSADVQSNTVIGGLRPLPTKASRALLLGCFTDRHALCLQSSFSLLVSAFYSRLGQASHSPSSSISLMFLCKLVSCCLQLWGNCVICGYILRTCIAQCRHPCMHVHCNWMLTSERHALPLPGITIHVAKNWHHYAQGCSLFGASNIDDIAGMLGKS